MVFKEQSFILAKVRLKNKIKEVSMGRFSMMVCPLCGRSRKVYAKRWQDPEIRWDYWDKDSP